MELGPPHHNKDCRVRLKFHNGSICGPSTFLKGSRGLLNVLCLGLGFRI